MMLSGNKELKCFKFLRAEPRDALLDVDDA